MDPSQHDRPASGVGNRALPAHIAQPALPILRSPCIIDPLIPLSPRDLADLLVEAAEEKKAWDPIVMDLRGKTTIADYFVVCEGETDRQLRAIADGMIDAARERSVRPLSVGGYEEANWILLDFDSVLAHILLPGERSYYDLEGLWVGVEAQRAAG